MNEEIKTAWVAALRSGEYPQGFGRLKTLEHDDYVQSEFCKFNPAGYCCLGVLMELAVKAGIIADDGWWYNQPALLWRVAEWAGLVPKGKPHPDTGHSQWVDPYVTYDDSSRHLSEMNDSERLSFSRIADLIEAQTLRTDEKLYNSV